MTAKGYVQPGWRSDRDRIRQELALRHHLSGNMVQRHGCSLDLWRDAQADEHAVERELRLRQHRSSHRNSGNTCRQRLSTRLYAYDGRIESHGSDHAGIRYPTCATEGGQLESHSYDSANRLIDAGVSYETFGNTTKLPATDAGKYELTSSYYVDNQIASQTQNGETINYYYDPEGRTRETVSTGKTAATVVCALLRSW